jgi:Spx/MgsR family transcriptional regulator
LDEIELYLYAKCSSCRSADALLGEYAVEPHRRDLFAQPLSAQELRALLAKTGLNPHQLLSKRSRPYRELKLGERELGDGEIIDLMAHHPALIRRPLVVKGTTAVVGFDRDAILALAKSGRRNQND